MVEVAKISRNSSPGPSPEGLSAQSLATSVCAWAAAGTASRPARTSSTPAAARIPARATAAARPPVPRLTAKHKRRKTPMTPRSAPQESRPGHADAAGPPAAGRSVSRLSALGSRLSALGSRLSALGSRLSALGSRLSALGSRLSALGSRLSALGSRLSALGSRLSALGSRLSALLFTRPTTLSQHCRTHRLPSRQTMGRTEPSAPNHSPKRQPIVVRTTIRQVSRDAHPPATIIIQGQAQYY